MALRKHFKRYMAAICITRLFRYITVQKAQDTIYMVRKIKEMLYNKIAAATLADPPAIVYARRKTTGPYVVLRPHRRSGGASL